MTWGTGYGASKAIIEGAPAPWYFGPAKFAATTLSTLAGMPGGIFSPSIATGAGLGNCLCLLFPHDPRGAIVLLGMIAYFTGVVRAPLTAVIIVMEVTASRGMIIPLFASAVIADASAQLICKEKLYHGLAREFLIGLRMCRSQAEQPCAIAVLEQIDLAARALLDLADAVAHRPLVGLARPVAADADVDQGFARQRAEQSVALPLREKFARIDDQSRRADRRVPPDLGRLITVADAMVADVDSIVIAAVRSVRPAIVAAAAR